ncbi:MAG: PrsW family intramembrane metalloprotease [Bacteroidales bacterium]|nr:PrsW family intramembrane metalloprotease [Bacteroidales bacterium]
MSITFISAILPVVLLLIFIYRKDKYHPEPTALLTKLFFVGCLSVIPASIMEMLLQTFTPSQPVLGGIFDGYCVAGFSEELCKLALLMWVVWKSPYFDEYFDGIVYATFLSLGFACVENIMYVVGSNDPMAIALSRGLLAVPAHFLFAVIMGYHLSLAKFDLPNRNVHLRRAFLYPFLLHGTYDALLMVSDALTDGFEDEVSIGVAISGVLMLVFLVFDVMMWRWGMKRIKRMQERSKEQNFDRQHPFEGFNWDIQ